MLIGATFRTVGMGQLSISHYDEGVYALAAHGVLFPGHEFFAPPLFPLVLRPTARLWPWEDTPLFLANVILGVVGVVLAALVAAGVSRGAALAAAALVACSGWHIVFSRVILTDVLFADWVLLAVAASSRFVANTTAGVSAQQWRWAALLGVALLGAWYTKYATPVLVMGVVSGSFAVLVASRTGWRPAIAGSLLLLVVVAVSFVGYLPWVAYVQGTVGYDNLLAHHRGYLLGWRAWFSSALEYARYARFLSPQASAVGLGVLIAASLMGAFGKVCAATPRLLGLLALAAAAILVGDVLWPVVGLIGFAIRRPSDRLGFATSGMTAVVLGLFFVVTPLYRPYPRLGVPTVVLGCVATGVLIDAVVATGRGWSLPLAIGVTAIIAAVAIFTFVQWFGIPPLQSPPRQVTTLEQAVKAVRAAVSGESVVCVYARPGVAFYLAPHVRVQLLGDPDGVRQALRGRLPLVVDTALLLDNPPADELLRSAGAQPLRVWPYSPSLPVRLNDWHHRSSAVEGDWPYWLWLFR